jgi:shikimate kinase
MKTNVALIGFMGAGKTAAGKALAARLGMEFVEMDDLITSAAGKPIPDIFRDAGEIGFREVEIEVTRQAALGTGRVIACGGGAVLNKINIDRLRETSRTVYLTASPAAVLRRTSADPTERPLLAVDDPKQQIKELMAFRRPFYERAADITVNTSRLTTEGVAAKIAGWLEQDEDFRIQK